MRAFDFSPDSIRIALPPSILVHERQEHYDSDDTKVLASLVEVASVPPLDKFILADLQVKPGASVEEIASLLVC